MRKKKCSLLLQLHSFTSSVRERGNGRGRRELDGHWHYNGNGYRADFLSAGQIFCCYAKNKICDIIRHYNLVLWRLIETFNNHHRVDLSVTVDIHHPFERNLIQATFSLRSVTNVRGAIRILTYLLILTNLIPVIVPCIFSVSDHLLRSRTRNGIISANE